MAQHYAGPGHLDRILVKSAGRISFERVDEIDWVEAADYYACLHTGRKTHLLRRSMVGLERDWTPAASAGFIAPQL